MLAIISILLRIKATAMPQACNSLAITIIKIRSADITNSTTINLLEEVMVAKEECVACLIISCILTSIKEEAMRSVTSVVITTLTIPSQRSEKEKVT